MVAWSDFVKSWTSDPFGGGGAGARAVEEGWGVADPLQEVRRRFLVPADVSDSALLRTVQEQGLPDPKPASMREFFTVLATFGAMIAGAGAVSGAVGAGAAAGEGAMGLGSTLAPAVDGTAAAAGSSYVGDLPLAVDAGGSLLPGELSLPSIPGVSWSGVASKLLGAFMPAKSAAPSAPRSAAPSVPAAQLAYAGRANLASPGGVNVPMQAGVAPGLIEGQALSPNFVISVTVLALVVALLLKR